MLRWYKCLRVVIQFTALVGVLFQIFKMLYSTESTAMLKIAYKKMLESLYNMVLIWG